MYNFNFVDISHVGKIGSSPFIKEENYYIDHRKTKVITKSGFCYPVFSRGGFVKKLIPITKKNTNGYCIVRFFYNGVLKNYLVHRLIAQAFIPNPENKPCVNHINGIKDDNRVENLEWCTHAENQNHAIKTGLKIQKTKGQVIQMLNGVFVKKYLHTNDIYNQTGFNRRRVSWSINSGNKAYGFNFYRENETTT